MLRHQHTRTETWHMNPILLFLITGVGAFVLYVLMVFVVVGKKH